MNQQSSPTPSTAYTFEELLDLVKQRLEQEGIEASALQEAKKQLPKEVASEICKRACILEEAREECVSFLHNSAYIKLFEQSHAGLIFVSPSLKMSLGDELLEQKRGQICFFEPATLAFQAALDLLHPPLPTSWTTRGTIHPSAVIEPSAQIGPEVTIGPGCVIGPRVVIGGGTELIANVTLYGDSSVGENCLLHAGVVVREGCRIGDRVILQPNVTIGSCGYGYAQFRGKHLKLTQSSYVEIEEDVEVGAGSCIDRGHLSPTIIGRGTKIDNLVQIGHGVTIGPYNLLVGQSGVAGSSKTGSHVVLAGQSGINGHIKVADQVTIAARSGVTKSIRKPRSFYAGSPATSMDQWRREVAAVRQLVKKQTRAKRPE